MRILLPVLLVAAVGVRTQAQDHGREGRRRHRRDHRAAPRTPTEKAGAAIEEAGDKVKEATR